jgi:hypothetical protein
VEDLFVVLHSYTHEAARDARSSDVPLAVLDAANPRLSVDSFLHILGLDVINVNISDFSCDGDIFLIAASLQLVNIVFAITRCVLEILDLKAPYE